MPVMVIWYRSGGTGDAILPDLMGAVYAYNFSHLPREMKEEEERRNSTEKNNNTRRERWQLLQRYLRLNSLRKQIARVGYGSTLRSRRIYKE